MDNLKNEIPSWIKSKGYLHLTPNIDVNRNWKSINLKVTNPYFIKKYAFYPLIHSVIKERKYKKIDPKKFILKNKLRSHKLKNIDNGKTKSSAKERPLHYASHFDSIIYAYYASLLQTKYEQKLSITDGLSNCITAYRKLKINPHLDDKINGNGKSTIHFAKEIFDEIINRSKKENIAVLAFDIKSFFSSLDHERLKEIWKFIIEVEELSDDHLAVYKASTQFSYILLDDLRLKKTKTGKKTGFDEKKLAHIRKKKGYKCFFESNKDFRRAIKSGKLKIYKNPFWNKNKKANMGIPQGLPISAILANMYLYNFDLYILENLVKQKGCFYRRYSDDIILICNIDQIDEVKKSVELQMEDNFVEISKDKTEIFKFKHIVFNKEKQKRLTSFKIKNDDSEIECPLTYLGFEFRGYNTLIKSANISKFYRRLISVVKRRAKRAAKTTDPFQKKAIFINQIKKLYRTIPKKKDTENESKALLYSRKILVANNRGEFHFEDSKHKPKKQSNYFSYLKRVSKIMEDDAMNRQLRKSKHVLHTAIKKHLNK